jgi:DNA modification methylase
MNRLLLGDNLEILKTLESESIDLIYLDPPFFSNRNYEVIWGDAGEIRSFQDRWSGGIDHYIAWLKERVLEMHRVLKPTGSIFLHCDWHANAYIRVFVLDKVFGGNNFRNEIIWKRADTVKGNFGQNRKTFDPNADTIFFYTKNGDYTFEELYKPYSDEYLETFYKYVEPETGRRYRLISMIGPGGAAKGNPFYEVMGIARHWRYSQAKMKVLIEKQMVIQTRKGAVPQRKQYLDEGKGVALQTIWDDISALSATSKERIGYPTQKPESLLERIILCASNEDDVILDPFVGGGTTVAVADKLKRNWIGIDQSVQAVKVSEMRLQKNQDLFSKPFIVQLHKYDYDTLRYSNAFEFESWIIQQLGGIPNLKQRNDFGLDGRTSAGIPIQVKRSDNIGRNIIDNFKSACERFDKNLFDNHKTEGKSIGILIAFSFGKGAIQEVARLKNQENTIIELLKVDEIVPIAKKPKLRVEFTDLGLDAKGLREIEFTAFGESEVGIEFYAWNFNYNALEGFKADVIIDKIGKQIEKFSSGSHQIAVKVVDNEGLESLEVIELKVNGVVST